MGNSSLWTTYVCVCKGKKWYSAPRVHTKTRSRGAQAQLWMDSLFSLVSVISSHRSRGFGWINWWPRQQVFSALKTVLLGPFLPLVRSAVVSSRHHLSDTVWFCMESGMNTSPLEVSFPLGHNLPLSKGLHLMPFLCCNKTAQHETKQNNEQKLEQPPVEMTKENKTRVQPLSYQWSPGFFSRSFLLMFMWETDSSLKVLAAAAARGSTWYAAPWKHPENLALHAW